MRRIEVPVDDHRTAAVVVDHESMRVSGVPSAVGLQVHCDGTAIRLVLSVAQALDVAEALRLHAYSAVP